MERLDLAARRAGSAALAGERNPDPDLWSQAPMPAPAPARRWNKQAKGDGRASTRRLLESGFEGAMDGFGQRKTGRAWKGV